CVKSQTPRQVERGRDSKIPQSGGFPEKVGDEAVHKELGDKMERAATTASSLTVEQDSSNINRTQSMATLNEPMFLNKQVEGMSKHKEIYDIPSHFKKVFANMKRQGNNFSGRITPLFPTMMVLAQEDMGEASVAPTDSHSMPIITQPSTSKPPKKQSRRKQRKNSGPT
ncbi:hypothetical protein Tco_0734568, partial [Tanacetum coccineum]